MVVCLYAVLPVILLDVLLSRRTAQSMSVVSTANQRDSPKVNYNNYSSNSISGSKLLLNGFLKSALVGSDKYLDFIISPNNFSSMALIRTSTEKTLLNDNFYNVSRFEVDNFNASGKLTPEQNRIIVVTFAICGIIGFLGNMAVLMYIVIKKLFRNFVSSHFIAHLAFTNSLACAILIPLLVQNIHYDGVLFRPLLPNSVTYGCRFHTFLTCAIWSVSYYMTTSIAGVHLLTFARIHYDQLFGLHPSIICFLSWLIGIALGLPCLTNASIVRYEENYYHCLWQNTASGFKFLAYMVLLGILLPISLTTYAYIRVLAIFYHAPIVFETLGIFKSRYLIFAIMATPLLQLPFFISRVLTINDPLITPIFMFMAFAPSVSHSIIYGLSIFLMKEDDMALTARSHKATYTAPGVPVQEL